MIAKLISQSGLLCLSLVFPGLMYLAARQGQLGLAIVFLALQTLIMGLLIVRK